MKISFLKRNILVLNLIVLATAFSPFIGERNINYLVIGFMIFSISITLGHFLEPHKSDWALYLLPFTMLLTGILHLNSFRPSSYFYGVLFILFFLSNLYLIRSSEIKIGLYKNLLKVLIYGYFIVLIIQQAMYIIGIENFFNKISSKGFNFNSIATEPSYAAVIIVILFYSYIFIKKAQNNDKYRLSDFRNDGMLWFVFTYQMLTLGSSFGILFFVLFMLSFIKHPLNLIGILSLLLIVYFSGLSLKFEPILRLKSVIQALMFSSSDYSNLIKTDHSASVRIIPFLMTIRSFEFIKLFGMGMDFSPNYFPTVIAGLLPGINGGPLLPSFIIDNGLINTIILIVIIKQKAIQKFFSFGLLLFIIILLNTSFNSQLFWAVVTILTINSHFKTYLIHVNLAKTVRTKIKKRKVPRALYLELQNKYKAQELFHKNKIREEIRTSNI